MALTQIGSGGIANVTNAANATFLTIDASEQITVASEGGAVTTSLQQGLCKAFGNNNAAASLRDSFGLSSSSDEGTGNYRFNFTSNMSSDDFAVVTSTNGASSGEVTAFQSGSGERGFCNVRDQTTARYGVQPNGDDASSAGDAGASYHAIFGDLA